MPNQFSTSIISGSNRALFNRRESTRTFLQTYLLAANVKSTVYIHIHNQLFSIVPLTYVLRLTFWESVKSLSLSRTGITRILPSKVWRLLRSFACLRFSMVRLLGDWVSPSPCNFENLMRPRFGTSNLAISSSVRTADSVGSVGCGGAAVFATSEMLEVLEDRPLPLSLVLFLRFGMWETLLWMWSDLYTLLLFLCSVSMYSLFSPSLDNLSVCLWSNSSSLESSFPLPDNLLSRLFSLDTSGVGKSTCFTGLVCRRGSLSLTVRDFLVEGDTRVFSFSFSSPEAVSVEDCVWWSSSSSTVALEFRFSLRLLERRKLNWSLSFRWEVRPESRCKDDVNLASDFESKDDLLRGWMFSLNDDIRPNELEVGLESDGADEEEETYEQKDAKNSWENDTIREPNETLSLSSHLFRLSPAFC